jgi:hypothetical protein
MITAMERASRHVSVIIDRPSDEVYRYICDPANLPHWAAGLASGISAEDGRWFAESPMGRVEIVMAPANPFGVLDHDVITADGAVMNNPLRVVPADRGSEVIFTVRRRELSDEDFDRDAAAVQADLQTLKTIMEDGR